MTDKTNQTKCTLYAVGDSTVSNFTDNIYMPRVGWGVTLSEFFNSNLTVNNLAISGTSSKSFLDRPQYQEFVNNISQGDFLIIGFGHNDQKVGAVTYTDPKGDYKTEGSFAYSLYNNYIKIAQSKGANCILCTPIPRRDLSGQYVGEYIHNTVNGDYPEAIRKLGADLNIPVCDLTTELVDIIKRVDADDNSDNDSLFQHARTGSNPVCTDDTHTSLLGAMVNSYVIAQDLRKSDSPIKEYLLDELENPLDKATEWKNKSINKDYVDPVYEQPKGGSTFWPTYTDAAGNTWYGTVFGDIFCFESFHDKTKFMLETDASGAMHISAGLDANNGKIATTSDGIAMYFMRLPVKDGFKLTANVTLNSFNTAGAKADLSAFGLMVRDDMYIDVTNGNLLGDYVSAGILYRGETPNGSNTFARRSFLNAFEGGELKESPNVGDTIPMMIASTGDGYMAQIGDNDPVIAGYDFTLTRNDPEYVYIGFFAARTVDITITDINLEVNGSKCSDYNCY